MDNVGVVVESLDDAISFFTELGLTLEGRAMVEGEWAGRVTGLGNQRVEIAMMVTPDGHSRLALSRFLAPPVVADHRNAPVIGDYRRGEKTREREAAVAVGPDHHGDLDALITQSSDASGPFSFNHRSPLARQAKLGEKRDRIVERFHYDADIVHS